MRTAELMIIQATTFNLLLCHSICAQITLLIQGGLLFPFFPLLSIILEGSKPKSY